MAASLGHADQKSSRLAPGWSHANEVARDRRGISRVNLHEYRTSITLVGLLDFVEAYMGVSRARMSYLEQVCSP